MKQSKRALSMLLAILMALTTGFSAMLPAFAEEGNEAMIDGTEYATLGEAIEKSNDGDTITLLRNLTLTATNKEIYKNITIDGGDAKYTITASDAYTFQFCDSFTLKNLKFQTTHGFRFWNTNKNGRTELVGTLENVEWTVSNALLANIQGEKSGVPQTLNIIDSKIANLSGKGDSLIATYNNGKSNVTINIKNSSLTQNGGSAAFSNIGNRAIFYFHINSNVVLNLQGNSILNYNPRGCAGAVHASICTKDAKVTVNADSSVGLNLLDSGAVTTRNYFAYNNGSGKLTVNDAGAAWNVSAAIAERGFYLPASGSYDVNETRKALVSSNCFAIGTDAQPLTYRKSKNTYTKADLVEADYALSGYTLKIGETLYNTWEEALAVGGEIELIANAPNISAQKKLTKDVVIDGQGKYIFSSTAYFFELVGHSAAFRNLNLNVAKGIGTGIGDGAAVLFENCKIDVTGGLLLNIKAQTNVIFRNTTVVSTAADAAILLQAGATSEIKLMNSTIDYRKGGSGDNTSIINIASKSKGTVVLDGTSKLIYSPNSTGANNQIITVHDAETAAAVHLKAGATLEYNTVPKSTTSLAFLRNASASTLNLVDEGATWKVSAAVAKKGYSFVNTSGTFNCKTVAMKAADGKLYSPTEVIKLTAATTFAPVAMGVTNEAGASIRLDLPTGIRFGTQIDKTFYETLGASAVYGVRVARKDVLKNGNFAALTDENSVSYTSAQEGFCWVTEGEFFRTVLMNINEANYQTELSWSAFVTVTYADGKTATYYADYTEADNCRSLAQVASRALQDTTVTWTADETALLKTIAGIND